MRVLYLNIFILRIWRLPTSKFSNMFGLINNYLCLTYPFNAHLKCYGGCQLLKCFHIVELHIPSLWLNLTNINWRNWSKVCGQTLFSLRDHPPTHHTKLFKAFKCHNPCSLTPHPPFPYPLVSCPYLVSVLSLFCLIPFFVLCLQW